MKYKSKALILLTLLTSFGCAHSHPVDGPQEKSEIPAGIRVGIGGKEIKEGDKVSVFTTTCRRTVTPRRIQDGSLEQCTDNEVGTAIVLKVLDHDSAIVAPENDLVMDTSMKVEKQKGENE